MAERHNDENRSLPTCNLLFRRRRRDVGAAAARRRGPRTEYPAVRCDPCPFLEESVWVGSLLWRFRQAASSGALYHTAMTLARPPARQFKARRTRADAPPSFHADHRADGF